MGVLTRDLDHGCAVQPDMSGISFDPPATHRDSPHRSDKNDIYQGVALQYLRSGSAFIAVRSGAALSDATKQELARNRALFSDGKYVLRVGGAPQ